MPTTTVYAAVYNSGDSPSDYSKGCDYTSKSYACNSGDMTTSHRSGPPMCIAGKKKNFCLKPNSPNTVYDKGDSTGIPCGNFGGKLVGTPVFLDGHSTALLQCTYNVDDKLLQDMSQDAISNTAGYNGFSIYQQLLGGMQTDGLNVQGYCDDNSNYFKKINTKTSQTCQNYLDNDLKSIEYCKKNPTDAFCSCYNIAQGLDFCKQNPNYPGCVEVLKGYKAFTDSGARVQFETTCYAPGVCSKTGVFRPKNVEDCNTSPQFCTQFINLTDAQITGDATITASCKQQQTKTDEQKSKDDEAKAPQDTGAPSPPPPTGDQKTTTPPQRTNTLWVLLISLAMLGIALVLFNI